MKLQEAVQQTIAHGDLRYSVLRETGADRMAALGRSDPLGAALWRVTTDHDYRALTTASVLIAHRIRRGAKDSLGPLIRLARVVLHEWLADKCTKCGGLGFIMARGEVKSVCTACDGERIGYHSDAERCRSMKISRQSYPRWEARFADAHAGLSDALDRVRRQAARQLGRGVRSA